jgi:hypothetical protein
LTEERLKVLGFTGGNDELSSAEIRNIIIAASAKVDAFCNAPKQPVAYSFRGGVVVDDPYDWFPGDSLTQSQKRLFLRQTPLKSVEGLRIYVTLTNFTEFAPEELMLNKVRGSLEIISFALTSTTPFGAYVLPNMGLQTPQARVDYTYGWEFTSVDEILEPTDANVYRAVNQFWDASDVEVKVGDVVVAPGDYTVDRTEGTITFSTQQAADALVTASYAYTLPQDIALATGWIAHDMITERELHDKGLGNVRSLRVGEIAIDRGRGDIVGRTSTDVSEIAIPAEAEGHLLPYRFITVR